MLSSYSCLGTMKALSQITSNHLFIPLSANFPSGPKPNVEVQYDSSIATAPKVLYVKTYAVLK